MSLGIRNATSANFHHWPMEHKVKEMQFLARDASAIEMQMQD